MAGGKGKMSGTGWHIETDYRFQWHKPKSNRKTIYQPSVKRRKPFVLKNFCNREGKIDIGKFMGYMNKNFDAFSGDSNKQTREILIILLKEQARVLNIQIPKERIEKKNITYIIDRLSF